MERASTYVKIPRERVGVLIGPNGRIKERVETENSVMLDIDSETGNVGISVRPDALDPSLMFRAKEVVSAIGRGFSPERAFRLFEDDETLLEIIDLREILGRSYSDMSRLKGRIIGKGGRTRELIQELTNTEISVYGHTVSIIGTIDQTQIAREAVLMLIRGNQHRTVYQFLHRKKGDLKKKEIELWETRPPEEKQT